MNIILLNPKIIEISLSIGEFFQLHSAAESANNFHPNNIHDLEVFTDSNLTELVFQYKILYSILEFATFLSIDDLEFKIKLVDNNEDESIFISSEKFRVFVYYFYYVLKRFINIQFTERSPSKINWLSKEIPELNTLMFFLNRNNID